MFAVLETLRSIGDWVRDEDVDSISSSEDYEPCGDRVWLVDPTRGGVALMQHESDLKARPQFWTEEGPTVEDWKPR